MDNEIPELLILAARRETLGLREESCVLLVAFWWPLLCGRMQGISAELG